MAVIMSLGCYSLDGGDLNATYVVTSFNKDSKDPPFLVYSPIEIGVAFMCFVVRLVY